MRQQQKKMGKIMMAMTRQRRSNFGHPLLSPSQDMMKKPNADPQEESIHHHVQDYGAARVVPLMVSPDQLSLSCASVEENTSNRGIGRVWNKQPRRRRGSGAASQALPAVPGDGGESRSYGGSDDKTEKKQGCGRRRRSRKMSVVYGDGEAEQQGDDMWMKCRNGGWRRHENESREDVRLQKKDEDEEKCKTMSDAERQKISCLSQLPEEFVKEQKAKKLEFVLSSCPAPPPRGYGDDSRVSSIDEDAGDGDGGVIGKGRKHGEAISKGHRSYELMVNLQLGIRYSVGRITQAPAPAPAPAAECRSNRVAALFHPPPKPAVVSLSFPSHGSPTTPPHHSPDFKWKDFCPLVFRQLRQMFKIDAAEYMLSICGNNGLRRLSSPGKSGSIFYLSHDERYIIKTLRKAELKVLLRMLPRYCAHVETHQGTLLTRFLGLHMIQTLGGHKVRFVVMGNAISTGSPIHRRFDLKGSSHGRTAAKVGLQENTVLKDLDLEYVFRLDPACRDGALRQIAEDCKFLESENIMDYSLLLGLRFNDIHSSGCTEESSKAHIGSGMPAMACNEDDPREARAATLYFGIIDILQEYDMGKKLEHAYKSLQYDPLSISAVDPVLYSRRFRQFMHDIFPDATL